MKIIKNVDITLSMNKSREDILFESIDDIVQVYPVKLEILNSLKKNENAANFIGYVKHYLFDESDYSYDFIPVYVGFDDFEVIINNVRYYNGFLISASSEGDFRSKMKKIDKGNITGFYKFKDF